jgi:cathepsin D
MGLAWERIAQTGAVPFWEALAESGTWTTQEMGVFMQRYRGTANPQEVETEGGSLTLGYVEPLFVH